MLFKIVCCLVFFLAAFPALSVTIYNDTDAEILVVIKPGKIFNSSGTCFYMSIGTKQNAKPTLPYLEAFTISIMHLTPDQASDEAKHQKSFKLLYEASGIFNEDFTIHCTKDNEVITNIISKNEKVRSICTFLSIQF